MGLVSSCVQLNAMPVQQEENERAIRPALVMIEAQHPHAGRLHRQHQFLIVTNTTTFLGWNNFLYIVHAKPQLSHALIHLHAVILPLPFPFFVL